MERIVKLQRKIDEIENLMAQPAWGPNFELWKSATGMLLKNEFGNEARKLFDQQMTVDVFADFHAYGMELVRRKEILEGLIKHADEYHPESPVSSIGKLVQSGKNGVVFEVGGNMVNNGVIHTTKDAVVGVAVAGDYSSNNSKIIQGDVTSKGWHERPVGIIVLTVCGGLIVAGIAYWLGWH